MGKMKYLSTVKAAGADSGLKQVLSISIEKSLSLLHNCRPEYFIREQDTGTETQAVVSPLGPSHRVLGQQYLTKSVVVFTLQSPLFIPQTELNCNQ